MGYLSEYSAAGCGFGHTYCGRYCYARFSPDWLNNKADTVVIKRNAPELLAAELEKAKDCMPG